MRTRRPFIIAGWMLIAFAALWAGAFVVNALPISDSNGYPIVVGAKGAGVYFCGVLPVTLLAILGLGLTGRLPGTCRAAKPGRCADCGYDLSGTQGGGCPECGRQNEPDPLSPRSEAGAGR